MDATTLATEVVAVLAPALPYLFEAGGKVMEGAAERIGENAWDKATAVWERLRGKVAEDAAVKGTADKLARQPDDERRRQALVLLLSELLEEDEGLAKGLATVVGSGTAITQRATVNGASAAAQAAESSTAASATNHGLAAAGNLTVIEKQHIQVYLQQIVGSFAGAAPPPDLEAGMQRYQQDLLAKYTFLQFRGMGVDDRLPLHLPLLDLYIPSRGQARLPEGDTPERQIRIAGRRPSAEELEAMGERTGRVAVLDLLHANDGLVLLGDPGAGKSTFLKFLALTFARGEGKALGLGLRLPVLAPLVAYAGKLQERRSLAFASFLADLLAEQGVVRAKDLLEEGMRRGRMLFLLDGLDEAVDDALRNLIVARVQDFFRVARRDGNKLVVTSRIVGYRETRLSAEGLVECTLTDFDDEEIETFVGKWTAVVEKTARGAGAAAVVDAERERKGLLGAIERSPGVRQLAANPLLLTILATMKRQGVELPERRAELYDIYVNVLLRKWNLARSLSGLPSPALHVRETVKILAPLALWMQTESPGRSEVAEGALRRELRRLFAEQAASDPDLAAEQFLAGVRDHTALLVDRGGRRFGFIHLTFQEYLAAVALKKTGDLELPPLVDALAARIGTPEWLEVCLLAVGALACEREGAAGVVLTGLLERGPGKPGEVELFAGRAALDTGRQGLPKEARARIVEQLLAVLGDDQRVSPPLRADAGEVLAELGDPRPGVTTLAGMEFCWVPAGPFLMGSKKGDEDAWEDELEQRETDLPYAYCISRFPVTVAQFGEYLERSREALGDPDALRGPANAPVVSVSWHEALAFCRWLTGTWREEGRLGEGWEVHLPSEAEWEKAARGGLEMPAQVPAATPMDARGTPSAAGALRANPEPARAYPWGKDFDANRANCSPTDIDRPSAVGCFPGGASPYGVEDLSGNVLEWTRSRWAKYPYRPADGREELTGDDDRVLRGGSFHGAPWDVRCAVRFGYSPVNRGDGLGFRVVVAPFSSGL